MHFKKYFLLLALSLFVYAEGHGNNGTNTHGVASSKTGADSQGHAHSTGGPKAHGDKNNGTDHKGHDSQHKHKDMESLKCAEISHLTTLTKLVSNATELAAFEAHHNLSSAEIQKLKAEAANATSKLTQLEKNATLVSDCAVLEASEKLKAQCHEIEALTKVVSLANNATALQALESKHNLTAAEIAKLKDKAANATAELTKLQSNATLVAACNHLKTENGSSGASTTCMLCVIE